MDRIIQARIWKLLEYCANCAVPKLLLIIVLLLVHVGSLLHFFG